MSNETNVMFKQNIIQTKNKTCMNNETHVMLKKPDAAIYIYI